MPTTEKRAPIGSGSPTRKESVILRATMANEIQHIDDRKTMSDEGVQRIFDLADSDYDGVISRDEFKRLYAVIKGEVTSEHLKEAALENKAEKSKRRVRLLGCVTGALVLLVGVLLGGNTVLMYTLLEATKETRTGANHTLTVAGSGDPVRVASVDSHHDAGRLIDTASDAIIATAPALERVPMVIAPLLSIEMLNQVTTIVVRRDIPAEESGDIASNFQEAFKVRKFRVYHALYMEFDTVSGDTIVIDRGTVYILDPLTNERTYTCASNVECASFLAAGVDVEDLSDNFQLALDTYRAEIAADLADDGNTTAYNATAMALGRRLGGDEDGEPFEGLPLDDEADEWGVRRRLNYEGHQHPDGSGHACKITRNGLHKMIIGGDGSAANPCAWPLDPPLQRHALCWRAEPPALVAHTAEHPAFRWPSVQVPVYQHPRGLQQPRVAGGDPQHLPHPSHQRQLLPKPDPRRPRLLAARRQPPPLRGAAVLVRLGQLRGQRRLWPSPPTQGRVRRDARCRRVHPAAQARPPPRGAGRAPPAR